MTPNELSETFLRAADLLDQRDYADPVEALLAAQGYDAPAADAHLAHKARWIIRKQDNTAAVVLGNLGGGQLLTDEQLADLTPEDWAGIDFDMNVCPDGPIRHEWAWWLRWCALDVRWAARMDALAVAA
jgi:hypothetical protein